jgi:hypothetical protein
VALGVPGRSRPRIFSTFGTTSVVGRQPNAPANFIPEENPNTHFQRLSRPQGTWFCRKEPRKKSQVTPLGIDPGTVRLVAQRYLYVYKLYIFISLIFLTKYCFCVCVFWNHVIYFTTYIQKLMFLLQVQQ